MSTNWIDDLAKQVIEEQGLGRHHLRSGGGLDVTMTKALAFETAVGKLTADQREELARSIRVRNTIGAREAFRNLYIKLENAQAGDLSSYGAQAGLHWAICAQLAVQQKQSTVDMLRWTDEELRQAEGR